AQPYVKRRLPGAPEPHAYVDPLSLLRQQPASPQPASPPVDQPDPRAEATATAPAPPPPAAVTTSDPVDAGPAAGVPASPGQRSDPGGSLTVVATPSARESRPAPQRPHAQALARASTALASARPRGERSLVPKP